MSSFERVIDAPRECNGYFQLTSLGSAAACPGVGNLVWIQAETQAIRYRADGVAPTAAIGTLINAGECHELNVGSDGITKIQLIEVTAGAKANIHVFK